MSTSESGSLRDTDTSASASSATPTRVMLLLDVVEKIFDGWTPATGSAGRVVPVLPLQVAAEFSGRNAAIGIASTTVQVWSGRIAVEGVLGKLFVSLLSVGESSPLGSIGVALTKLLDDFVEAGGEFVREILAETFS